MLRSSQLPHHALHAIEPVLEVVELLLERALILSGGLDGRLQLLALVSGLQRICARLQVLAPRRELRAGSRSEERRRRERQLLAHRRDELRASKIMQQRAMDNPKIEFLWNTVATEVVGTDKVETIKLENTRTGEASEMQLDGFFVAIGHTPNTDFLAGQLDVDENGYVNTRPGTSYTSIDGVFAAGDVQDHVYRQAITAAGSGCMAAIDAERWLEEKGLK